MPVHTLVVGPLAANCFIVSDGESPDALLVDAGGEPGRIAAETDSLGLVPRVLFSTHGHVDHVAANRALKERFPKMVLAMFKGEREILLRPSHNLSPMLGMRLDPPQPDRLLEEGDEIIVASLRFRVIHLPGHTPGGAALAGEIDGGPAVFDGDILFAGGIGRADFPGGDERALVESIRTKLLALPDRTRVYPGHGPETTIGAERRSNPFVAGS